MCVPFGPTGGGIPRSPITRTIRKYGLGHVKPAPLPLQPSIRSGYLMRGNTLAELASVAGIERNAFEETVARWNADVPTGTDTASAKARPPSRFHGDPEVRRTRRLAPIAGIGPFYAVRVVPGDIGTFAGLKTDEHARVIGPDNTPLKGLYAVGNRHGERAWRELSQAASRRSDRA